MPDTRPFDVVLFGATGFTGGLVAERLARAAREAGVRVALAGRDERRLGRLVDGLGDAGAGRLAALRADAGEPASLREMAGQGRVVLSTVGPYLRYGLPVVEACVAAGADYLDITGEPLFVDAVIARFDRPARERGLRLVSCCGFDSIPPDLAVWMAVRALAASGPVVAEGKVRTRAGFSGGTLHSALGIFAEGGKPTPALDREPPPGPGRRVRRAPPRIGRCRELGSWLVPLPTIDPQIVLRSARLLPEYGPDFTYAHYLRVPHLPAVAAAGAGAGALLALARFGPTRRLLGRLRAPGEGPSEAERARGHFSVRAEARGDGRRAVAEVRGGDPGYTETSRMVSEMALALALDRAALPERHGALTPVAAAGEVLLSRLRKAGLACEVLEGGA